MVGELLLVLDCTASENVMIVPCKMRLLYFRMDYFHVAIGRVIRGLDVLKKMETYGTIEGHQCQVSPIIDHSGTSAQLLYLKISCHFISIVYIQDGRSLAKLVIKNCGEIAQEELYRLGDKEAYWGNDD